MVWACLRREECHATLSVRYECGYSIYMVIYMVYSGYRYSSRGRPKKICMGSVKHDMSLLSRSEC